MQLSRSISGRVAIVTGAGSGMGRATAALLLAEGASVVAVDRDGDGLQGLANSFPSGAALHTVVADLVTAAAPINIVDAAHQAFGPVDILINAAGVSFPVELSDEGFADAWRLTFAVNVDAPVNLIAACLQDLQRNGDGRVVNIASTEGLGATAPMAPYTASKHAVVGLTKSLSVELGPSGVTVNCICPGPINTGMTADIKDEHKAIYARRRTSLRRYGEPEEVAHMILSLVLPAASFTTGAILTVDGGLSIRSN
jgi:3-oxoacyl-[acyl-carrier protein] reductase